MTEGCSPLVDRDGDGLNECEEKTIGTDDLLPDSDFDSIIDSAEVLYGLNPLQDDQKIAYSNDGFSNFEHFIRGFSPKVNLNKVPVNGFKNFVNEKGIVSNLPSYQIDAQNIPYVEIDGKNTNQVIAIVKIENLNNPENILWLNKVYDISKEKKTLKINLGDFSKLRLEFP